MYQSPVPLTFRATLSVQTNPSPYFLLFLTMRTYVTVTYDMRGATQDAKSTSPITAIAAIAYIAKPTKTAETQEREHFMLTEYTTPGASVEVRDDESIYSLLTERIKRTGEDTVIAERKTAPGQWTKVTTGEFPENVLSAAKGLIAFGIGRGMPSPSSPTTRYEWGVLDFALAAIGAVNVPIYDTDSRGSGRTHSQRFQREARYAPTIANASFVLIP